MIEPSARLNNNEKGQIFNNRFFRYHFFEYNIGLISIIVACLPIFLVKTFYIDWFNHLWTISNYKDHFIHTGLFPAFLDANLILAGVPVFYSVLFYPIMAIFSSLVGPDLAIRLAVVALMLVLFHVWYRLGYSLAASRMVGLVLGVAPVLAIYPLSDLYNSTAIIEFFGIGFANLSLVFALMCLTVPPGSRQDTKIITYLGASILFLVLVIGTHPITGYLWVLILSLPIAGLVIVRRDLLSRRVVIALLGYIGLAIIIVAPLIYNVGIYSKYIPVVHGVYYKADIDDPASRLLPFVVDQRLFSRSMNEISTPFLDTGINSALAVIVVWLLMRIYRYPRIAGATALLFGSGMAGLTVVITAASLDPSLYTGIGALDTLVHRLLYPIQFATRLVSWSNILFSLTIAGLMVVTPRSLFAPLIHGRSFTMTVMLVVGVLLASALAKTSTIILSHDKADALLLPEWSEPSSLKAASANYEAVLRNVHMLPPTFYGQTDYTMESAFHTRENTGSTPIVPVTLSRDIKRPYASGVQRVFCTESCIIRTNLFASLLVTLQHDGAAVAHDDIFIISGGPSIMGHANGRMSIMGHPGWNEVSFSMDSAQYYFRNATIFLWLIWALLLGWSAWRFRS